MIPNALVDLPPQDSYLESGRRPKPRQVVQGTGQNGGPDMAFNLRRRIYPDAYASTADPMDSVSPASCRLLAAKEGHIAVRSGDMEAGHDSLVNNPPGTRLPGHLPLPRCHYKMQVEREAYLHNNPARRPHEPLPDPVYHSNDQFNYDRVPYHPGINTGWYDPSGRGPDVQYGRYHPQYLLPPPFASRPYMNMYANDNLTMHWQAGTMGRSHYTNPLLCSQHMAGYAEPSGSHEPGLGAYPEAQYHCPMAPGTMAPPSVEGGAKHHADTPGTHSDGISQPSEPLRDRKSVV